VEKWGISEEISEESVELCEETAVKIAGTDEILSVCEIIGDI